MTKRFPYSLFGLDPRTVEAELAAERTAQRSMLENAHRGIAALLAEERSLTERTTRLRARKAHLDEAVASMALTAEREERIAAHAEERLQHELVALEGAHRRQLSDLRREEASLRALLHRDEERFRALVTRLRAALAVDGPAEEPALLPLAQAAIALDPPAEG